MFNYLLLTFAAFVFLAAPALAQDVAPVSKDLNKAPSGVYTIDPGHTSVLFKVNHLGFSMYHGRFNTVEGRLNFDAKVPEKSALDVVIDAASIDTNHDELEGKLKGEKAFNTAAFPKITFKALRVTRSGDHGTMIGDLTLLGITKPVTLNVSFHGTGTHPFSKKPTLGFSANGVINRSQWGFKEWLPMIGDAVQISIEAEFNKADPHQP